MKIKTLLLCTATLSLGACSTSGPRYTPRPEISQQNYTAANRMEDREDAESYEQYEQRELCQHYRRLPRNYVDRCAPEKPEEIVFQAETTVTPTVAIPVSPPPENRLLPIVQTYTVLFDFDKSFIRPAENQTLDKAMHEIKTYDPRQVTVTGYTDSSGQADYNQTLSRQREQAVSAGLLQRGIENQTLERNARGEYDQAVETADGVKNQENRRVVIDFRR